MRRKFMDKTVTSYQEFQRRVQRMNKLELIQNVDEIVRKNRIYREFDWNLLNDKHVDYLIQFKDPFSVICEQYYDYKLDIRYDTLAAINDICKMDIESWPHDLDEEYLPHDLNHRRKAAETLKKIVPETDIAKNNMWFKFIKESSSPDKYNAYIYRTFTKNLETVKKTFGVNIAQTLYDNIEKGPILDAELVEAGKFLYDGGNPDELAERARTGAFKGNSADAMVSQAERMSEFYSKLKRGYNAYIRELTHCTPHELIEGAEEIAATKLVYRQLKDGGYSSEYLEYFLRFKNPLEVIRDGWIVESNCAYDEEMRHVLWSVSDHGDAEKDYELDESFDPPEQEGGMSMC